MEFCLMQHPKGTSNIKCHEKENSRITHNGIINDRVGPWARTNNYWDCFSGQWLTNKRSKCTACWVVKINYYRSSGKIFYYCTCQGRNLALFYCFVSIARGKNRDSEHNKCGAKLISIAPCRS